MEKKNINEMTFDQIVRVMKESNFAEDNKIAKEIIRLYEEIPNSNDGLEKFKKLIEALKNHPAMEGYLLIDKFIELAEEEIKSFEVVKEAKDLLHK